MDRKSARIKNGKGQKIVVGMSGGVDSSASLILLKKNGWDPIGLSFKLPIWESKLKKQTKKNNEVSYRENKNSKIDIAKEICKKYGCEHYIVDIEKEFCNIVVKYFKESIENSRTPNPCMICNKETKFYHLCKFANTKKIKYIATGHYAKILKKGKKLFLSIPKDKAKDQTYYLSLLSHEYLERIIFPLGEITKSQVYNLVKNENICFYNKTDQSQDFCYMPKNSLDEYLEKEINSKEGNMLDIEGKILGKHKGLKFYTIGQRKKIGLAKGPYFVVKKDQKKNELVVSKNIKHLEKKEIFLSNVFFSDENMYGKRVKVKAKIRYQQVPSPALLIPEKEKKGVYLIKFNKAQTGVTPGQYAVFYIKNLCIGSGVIS